MDKLDGMMGTLFLAKPEELDEIFRHFVDCKEWFPHIRKDYVERKILSGNVIYNFGVIIVFNVYKRRQRLGNVVAQKDDIILHQILNPNRGQLGNEGCAEFIIKTFAEQSKTNVWLSVREENARAIAFYKKVGFEEVSKISWMGGKMPGLVFVKRYNP